MIACDCDRPLVTHGKKGYGGLATLPIIERLKSILSLSRSVGWISPRDKARVSYSQGTHFSFMHSYVPFCLFLRSIDRIPFSNFCHTLMSRLFDAVFRNTLLNQNLKMEECSWETMSTISPNKQVPHLCFARDLSRGVQCTDSLLLS